MIILRGAQAPFMISLKRGLEEQIVIKRPFLMKSAYVKKIRKKKKN